MRFIVGNRVRLHQIFRVDTVTENAVGEVVEVLPEKRSDIGELLADERYIVRWDDAESLFRFYEYRQWRQTELVDAVPVSREENMNRYRDALSRIHARFNARKIGEN